MPSLMNMFADDLNEVIASKTLEDFLSTTGQKIVDAAGDKEWTATSNRPHIRGMMDRYDDFVNHSPHSIYSIFRIQELHWLAHCRINPALQLLRETYVASLDVLSQSEYSDLTSYGADIPVFILGNAHGDPIRAVHYAPVASELAIYAKALKMRSSELIEMGRGWSLSRVVGDKYGEWVDKVYQPLYEKLMERAEQFTDALQEALWLLEKRRSRWLVKNAK